VASEVGDGSDIRSDNYADAEDDSDPTVRMFSFEGKMYIFGEKTIEPWWYSGQGAPPLELIDTAIIQKGTTAPYSVSKSDQYMYFLGDDLSIYQVSGNNARSISNSGIAEEINNFSDTDDAIGFCFNF